MIGPTMRQGLVALERRDHFLTPRFTPNRSASVNSLDLPVRSPATRVQHLDRRQAETVSRRG